MASGLEERIVFARVVNGRGYRTAKGNCFERPDRVGFHGFSLSLASSGSVTISGRSMPRTPMAVAVA